MKERDIKRKESLGLGKYSEEKSWAWKLHSSLEVADNLKRVWNLPRFENRRKQTKKEFLKNNWS